MRSHRILFVCFALLIAGLTGCVSNVSRDARYPTDYAVGGIYQLKRPVFAEKEWWTIFGYRGVILRDATSRAAEMPPSVEAYEGAKDHWKNIVAMLPIGQRIELQEIQLENNPENGNVVWVRGRLLDTDVGHGAAELAFISRHVPPPPRARLLRDMPMVDTNILELVRKP